MSNNPGKKAELDKDGISFDTNKAELDKAGISLGDVENKKELHEISVQNKQSDGIPLSKKTHFKTILAASILFLIAALGVIGFYSLYKQTPEYDPYAYVTTTVPQNVYTPEGDIVLDPFMILFTSQNQKESGVLLAQLSLQVTPESAANIESDIFAVRSLILERLSMNAQIYSKNEIADILKKDLEDFKVRDVSFIQYETR
ncbi:MAG TPA: hypothetical protein ENN05_10765 [Deltaproteobacteria bacterium]|nr:hypothetical protein [Deltaproteobacteria bacterium]